MLAAIRTGLGKVPGSRLIALGDATGGPGALVFKAARVGELRADSRPTVARAAVPGRDNPPGEP